MAVMSVLTRNQLKTNYKYLDPTSGDNKTGSCTLNFDASATDAQLWAVENALNPLLQYAPTGVIKITNNLLTEA